MSFNLNGGLNTLCINLQRAIRGFATICGATVAFGGASALSTTAFAQTPAAPAAPAAAPAAPASTATPWTYQGLFDMYYLYDGNANRGNGSAPVAGFEYDQEGSTPALSLAELNIAKAAPASGGLGFKATLIAGETADENDPGTSDEGRYKNVQQLYVTAASSSGAGIDFGKFYTPFGYEVTESNANMNYSRSFIFGYLLPVYHVGVRAYTQSYKGLVATGYVVKDILNYDIPTGTTVGYHAPTSSPGYIGQLNYTAPSGKYVAIESFGYDDDNVHNAADKTTLSDTDLTLTPTAVDTVGLNYTYRKDDINSVPSGHEDGYALYYRRQITTPYAFAIRGEYLDGKGGGASAHADSITGTLEDKATKSLLVRLEYRHDDTHYPSNLTDPAVIAVSPFYDGTNTKTTEDTLSLSAVYAFGP